MKSDPFPYTTRTHLTAPPLDLHSPELADQMCHRHSPSVADFVYVTDIWVDANREKVGNVTI